MAPSLPTPNFFENAAMICTFMSHVHDDIYNLISFSFPPILATFFRPPFVAARNTHRPGEFDVQSRVDAVFSGMSHCGICWDSRDDIISLPCAHKCCVDCLELSIKADIDTPRRPQCPCCLANGILLPITVDQSIALSSETLAAMLLIEKRLQTTITCECCQTLTSTFDEAGRLMSRCQTCAGNPRDTTQKISDFLFLRYFQDHGGIHCRQCSSPIIKEGGCQHVMCLCGLSFYWPDPADNRPELSRPAPRLIPPSPINRSFLGSFFQCFARGTTT